MEELIRHITQRINISEKEAALIVQKYKPKHLKKKEFLLKAGEICPFEAYVVKGAFKIFYLKSDGVEHILHFAIEDWWMADIASFNEQKPAHLYIQALEDSDILIISKTEKEKLMEEHPKLEKLFRQLSQRSQVALQNRIISSIGFTAKERYLDFLEQFPNIYPRISNMQLASYLGITQEFLSRLKKQLLKERY